jgi:transposase InsO family protein
MDITYIPMARGFIYLAAVLDWFSRRVTQTPEVQRAAQIAWPFFYSETALDHGRDEHGCRISL